MFLLNRRRLLLTALLAGVLGSAPMTTYADEAGPFNGSGGRSGLTLLDEAGGGFMGSGGRTGTGSTSSFLDEDEAARGSLGRWNGWHVVLPR